MNTNIQWQAPAYKISFIKMVVYIMLIPIVFYSVEFLGIPSNGIAQITFILVILGILEQIYKKKDPDANYIQLFLYHKSTADYYIEPSNLIIKVGNKKRTIHFDKINFFTTICPETNRFYSSPDFSILYLVLSKASYKKYLPIFVPSSTKESVIKKLSEYIKFYDKKEAEQKIKSNLIKYFEFLLIGGILLFFILFAIYQMRCSIYTFPFKDDSTFWDSVKTCNLI